MKKLLTCLIFLLALCYIDAFSQQPQNFNGLGMNLGNLQKLSSAQTFSISPENYSGEKGKGGMAELKDSNTIHGALSAHEARELGQGWKLNPAVKLAPGETFTLADITGEGALQHF